MIQKSPDHLSLSRDLIIGRMFSENVIDLGEFENNLNCIKFDILSLNRHLRNSLLNLYF